MTKDNTNEIALNMTAYAQNVLRAAIKGLPWIGTSLEQLVYGNVDERRWRRMERTLSEVGEEMKRRNIPPDFVLKEDFEQLLRQVASSASESTNEDKRKRFRDLLVNSVTLPEGDPQWESSRLAATYLEQLEGPAFSILAAIAAENAFDDSANKVSISRHPEPQVSRLSGQNASDYDTDVVYHALGYEWAVVQSWMEKLLELKLISFGTSAGAKGFGQIQLTVKGSFLVRWTISDTDQA